MQLHPACKARVTDLLRSALLHVRFRNGRFVDYSSLSSLWGSASTLPDSIRRQAQNWISDQPLQDFTFGLLSELLTERYPYDDDSTSRPLNERPEFRDLNGLANLIVDGFVALPWTYRLVVPLPLKVTVISQPVIGNSFELAPNMRLIPGSAMDPTLPLAEGADAISAAIGLIGRGPAEWRTDFYYLEATVEGCILDYLSPTNTITEFIRTLKAVAGAGTACGLLHATTPHSFYGLDGPIFAYKTDPDTGPKLKNSQKIPAPYAYRISSLNWSAIFQSPSSPENAKKNLRTILQVIRIVFSGREEAAPIRLASQWYFESLANDELLSFVQVIVALEILLGDRAQADKTGLGQLLANRCAYLLGDTNKSRRTILRESNAIYDTRSAIVHRGKNRLEPEERQSLYRARQICREVILREVQLLLGDATPDWIPRSALIGSPS